MHRVPSTVAFDVVVCRKTPSNLGVFIRSANSMSFTRPPTHTHTHHAEHTPDSNLWLTTHRVVILFTLINFLHFACGATVAGQLKCCSCCYYCCSRSCCCCHLIASSSRLTRLLLFSFLLAANNGQQQCGPYVENTPNSCTTQ